MSHVTYPLYIVRSVHIVKLFAKITEENAQTLSWIFILHYHTECSYMLPSTGDHHEGIKLIYNA